MHFPYSRNACVALSFGLALHHITLVIIAVSSELVGESARVRED
jgi:hypothetical protein